MNSRPDFAFSDVVVLAGGAGKRLGRLAGRMPKPMVPVLGRPFLEWVVIYLRSLGFGTFIMSVGYRRDAIKSHFGSGDGLEVEVRYVEESTPLGTGCALGRASAAAGTRDVLVLNGDSLCMCDMAAFFRFHRINDGGATICCSRVRDTSRYGTVTTGEGGLVEAFMEKGRSSGEGIINAGMYWMSKSFMKDIPDLFPLSLEKEVFPRCAYGTLYAYRSAADFIDIGTPEGLSRAPDFLRRNGFLHLPSAAGERR
ncbi:MAG: sugar phosphate nucleotidyltransferase [Candidatus Tritonobacter lacicola]|nr:sugar phosphate nucleotidyltransferase [Candidatus Tritonobacter lacicola]